MKKSKKIYGDAGYGVSTTSSAGLFSLYSGKGSEDSESSWRGSLVPSNN